MLKTYLRTYYNTHLPQMSYDEEKWAECVKPIREMFANRPEPRGLNTTIYTNPEGLTQWEEFWKKEFKKYNAGKEPK